MVTVYVTAPPDAAVDIARTLVAERLAACVNRIPCRSTYRWEGEVHEDEEEVLLAKTTADRADALVDRVRALHPYDVPAMERFDEAEAEAAFAEWRASAVAPE